MLQILLEIEFDGDTRKRTRAAFVPHFNAICNIAHENVNFACKKKRKHEIKSNFRGMNSPALTDIVKLCIAQMTCNAATNGR